MRDREVVQVMRWELQVKTELATLRLVRRLARRVAEREGASLDVAMEVEFAIGEVLRNAQQHAYREQAGDLRVEMRVERGEFWCMIRDHGEPIVDLPRVPASHVGPWAPGRGLYMISQLVDAVEILRPEDGGQGVAVIVRKRLTQT